MKSSKLGKGIVLRILWLHWLLIDRSARATSAASTYFKEFSHELSKGAYLNGRIYHNNPINIAAAESKRIWPQEKFRHPDIVLSIGLAFFGLKLGAAPDNSGMDVSQGEEDPSYPALIKELATDLFKNPLACERAWKNWIDSKMPPQEHAGRYRRLNVPRYFGPEMHHEENLITFTDRVNYYLQYQTRLIPRVANQLVASCFYYEFDKKALHEMSNEKETGWKCTGSSQSFSDTRFDQGLRVFLCNRTHSMSFSTWKSAQQRLW